MAFYDNEAGEYELEDEELGLNDLIEDLSDADYSDDELICSTKV